MTDSVPGLGGALLRAVAVQRRTREERPRKEDGPLRRRVVRRCGRPWHGAALLPSSLRPRSVSSESSPGITRPRLTPGPTRSSAWRRSSKTPESSSPPSPRGRRVVLRHYQARAHRHPAWPTRAQLHAAVFDYNAGWYNTRRLHSSLTAAVPPNTMPSSTITRTVRRRDRPNQPVWQNGSRPPALNVRGKARHHERVGAGVGGAEGAAGRAMPAVPRRHTGRPSGRAEGVGRESSRWRLPVARRGSGGGRAPRRPRP
jgi:hypothetical protein